MLACLKKALLKAILPCTQISQEKLPRLAISWYASLSKTLLMQARSVMLREGSVVVCKLETAGLQPRYAEEVQWLHSRDIDIVVLRVVSNNNNNYCVV